MVLRKTLTVPRKQMPLLSCIGIIMGTYVAISLCSSAVHAQPGMVQADPLIEKRVDSLLALMTIDEKVGQVNQLPGHWDEKTGRLEEDEVNLLRKGLVGSFLNIAGAEPARKIQRIAVEETRLHIPLLFGLDVIHGYRTIFPIPLGEASSWDPVLVEKDCRIAAIEASASGINWTFAPMVDIARDPRWGRIAEGSGEDPFLGSVMAGARVRGFQGTGFIDSTSIIACAKHFAAYGAAEAGRDYNTVDISERTLREVYLPPFRAAVRAGAGTIMSAFNEIGGVPSTANRELLTTILRGEWGFRGFVVSDWGAIEELGNHGIAGTPLQEAQRALTAGVDMDMAGRVYLEALPAAVADSKMPMQVLNEAVRRILRVKYAAGLFRNPYRNCQEELERRVILTPEHRAAARTAAARSFVLLKNQDGLLPLAKTISSIAVIGPLAESTVDPLGPWDGMGRADDVVSVLAGIKSSLPSGVRLTYSRGCDNRFSDTSGFSEAVKTAAASDVAILVAGETRDMSGEAASRSEIGLPGVQTELVRRIATTGTPIVLVLMNGRPLCIPWEADHVRAIIETWFPGVEAGNAVADVIFGKVNPGGKLPVTFPRSVGQIPIYYDHKSTGRPFSATDRFTSRYLDIPNTPLFPFGFGLSYTTFTYENFRIPEKRVRVHQPINVSVDVRNSGSRQGDEVIEVYVHQEVAEFTRPVMELKAFRRITLEPGERKTVEFHLDSDQLGYVGSDMKYTVEPGSFQVYIGGSSEKTLMGTFEFNKE